MSLRMTFSHLVLGFPLVLYYEVSHEKPWTFKYFDRIWWQCYHVTTLHYCQHMVTLLNINANLDDMVKVDAWSRKSELQNYHQLIVSCLSSVCHQISCSFALYTFLHIGLYPLAIHFTSAQPNCLGYILISSQIPVSVNWRVVCSSCLSHTHFVYYPLNCYCLAFTIVEQGHRQDCLSSYLVVLVSVLKLFSTHPVGPWPEREAMGE